MSREIIDKLREYQGYCKYLHYFDQNIDNALLELKNIDKHIIEKEKSKLLRDFITNKNTATIIRYIVLLKISSNESINKNEFEELLHNLEEKLKNKDYDYIINELKKEDKTLISNEITKSFLLSEFEFKASSLNNWRGFYILKHFYYFLYLKASKRIDEENLLKITYDRIIEKLDKSKIDLDTIDYDFSIIYKMFVGEDLWWAAIKPNSRKQISTQIFFHIAHDIIFFGIYPGSIFFSDKFYAKYFKNSITENAEIIKNSLDQLKKTNNEDKIEIENDKGDWIKLNSIDNNNSIKYLIEKYHIREVINLAEIRDDETFFEKLKLLFENFYPIFKATSFDYNEIVDTIYRIILPENHNGENIWEICKNESFIGFNFRNSPSDISQLKVFSNIKENDIIIAYLSNMRIGGIGIVTKNYYKVSIGQSNTAYFNNPNNDFFDRFDVNWIYVKTINISDFPKDLINQLKYVKTVKKIDRQDFIEIAYEIIKKDAGFQKIVEGNEKLAEILNIPYKPYAEDEIIVLEEKKQQEIEVNEKDIIEYLIDFIKSNGFYYSEDIIKNFYVSLKTKPFVILTGISGTGKTQLTKKFAEALFEDYNTQFLLLPVEPDWQDNKELLGFYNPISNKYQKTPFLEILLRARDNPNNLHLVCLDEMNLSKVEYYFSKLLSVMEVNDFLFLHDEDSLSDPPKKIHLPKNLLIVGTVNMDETTYQFSDKVLDRANTIELNEVFFDRIPKSKETLKELNLNALVFNKFKNSSDNFDNISENIIIDLQNIFNILKDKPGGFAYRIRKEILSYITNSKDIFDQYKAFDFQIKQKILPKIKGNSQEILEIFDKLMIIIASDKYPISFDKLEKMKEKYKSEDYIDFF